MRNDWISMPRGKRLRWALLLTLEYTVLLGSAVWLFVRLGVDGVLAVAAGAMVWLFVLAMLAQLVRAPERIKDWLKVSLKWAILAGVAAWVVFLVALFVAD